MTTGEGQAPPTDPLRAGIAAAKAGQRAEARALLQKAVERNDKNVTAWLWLSSVIDELDNRATCLEHVLEIDPENEAARRGLEQVRRQRVDDMLRSGIDAAKKGQRDHARKQLMQVVEWDEKNVTAWLWLSGLVASLDDRQVCLENVLSLDPNNEAARRGLEQLREQKAAIAPRPVTVYEPPTIGSRLEATTFAVDVPASSNDLSGEYLCPYCAAETDPDAKKCPQCGRSLVIRKRRREERSTAMWILICLQAPYAIFALFVLAGLFVLLRMSLTGTWTESLASALGPQVTQISAIAIVIAMFFELLPVVVLAGLVFRWRPVFWLLLVQAVISLVEVVVATLSSFRGFSIICGGILLLIAVAMVVLVFQTQDDFFFDYFRIPFRTDKECKTATDFFAHGSRYARQGMWALAALHYERAVGLMPNAVQGHLALSSTYIKLGRFQRAQEEIAIARQLSANDPELAEQVALLEKARGGPRTLA